MTKSRVLVFLLLLTVGSTVHAQICQHTTIAASPIEISVDCLSGQTGKPQSLEDKWRTNFLIRIGGDPPITIGNANDQKTLPQIRDEINRTAGAIAELTPEANGSTLSIQAKEPNKYLAVEPVEPTDVDLLQNFNLEKFFLPPILQDLTPKPDFSIFLSSETKSALKLNNIPARVHLANDAVIDLVHQSWILESTDKPLAILTIGEERSPLCPPDSTALAINLKYMSDHKCHREYLLVRRLANQDVIVGATVEQTSAAYPPQSKIRIASDIFADSKQFMIVNGKRLTEGKRLTQGGFPQEFDNSSSVSLGIYKTNPGCRLYSKSPEDWATVQFYPLIGPPSSNEPQDRGITVGPAKIYDTVSLMKMLNDTASQLAAISGFNSASITSAFNNLQGVTRDTSFISAQITTTPLPSVTSAISSGTTGNTSTTNSSPIAGSAPGTVTLQCPNGTLPTIGPGGLQQCTAVPPGTNISGSSSTITTVPASTSQQVTGTGTTAQNSTTTTQPSIVATVPVAPASTAFSAPSSVGLSASDILAEQVQLNAEITTLRLLLQGASSDQYLTTSFRTVANRQQTTLGFSVSLDPLRQYKHAVAEVRIIVVSPPGRDGVSIMTLLPTEKTYNVAKITSHQGSFGAGVALEPVTAGVNTGRSKDRLYLAKDTDTLALQYRTPSVRSMGRPFPQKIHDVIKGLIEFQKLDPCAEDIADSIPNAVVFGWQFRPVLGADYVRGGMRQVFAQLALPSDLNEPFVPTVFVQTRWRSYDSKRQIVGSIYRESCTVEQDMAGISLLSPLVVRDVTVTDIGNGQVRLKADGNFFAPAMTLRSGPNNVVPTMFDGKSIEAFANVHDILQAGDLTLVSQNGVKSRFAIAVDPDKDKEGRCGINKATLTAIPKPDGNSRAQLTLTLGEEYSLDQDADGSPHPLVLIGSQVFGLQETPFIGTEPNCNENAHHVTCTYDFIASTTVLRNAQSFLVRDIAREALVRTGSITFAPSFSSIGILSVPLVRSREQGTTASPIGARPSAQGNMQRSNGPDANPQCSDTTFYSVSGFNLLNPDYFLQMFIGDGSVPTRLNPINDNLTTMSLNSCDIQKTKAVRLQVVRTSDSSTPIEWNLTLPQTEKTPVTANLPFLRAGSSEQVIFSGGELATATEVSDVIFEQEGCKINFKKGPNGDFQNHKLTIRIPTCVTTLPGRKDFYVIFPDKPSQLVVGVDVFKQ